jgi:uncharacterized protein (DUF427 family)
MEGSADAPGFDDVSQRRREMQAVWSGTVVARSDDTVVVEGNHYFPIESVEPGCLSESNTRTLCLWKGVARYRTVTVDGTSAIDGAWYYPRPSPFARRVKGRVAFWRGVVVTPASPDPNEESRGADG